MVPQGATIPGLHSSMHQPLIHFILYMAAVLGAYASATSPIPEPRRVPLPHLDLHTPQPLGPGWVRILSKDSHSGLYHLDPSHLPALSSIHLSPPWRSCLHRTLASFLASFVIRRHH
ncbi:hypothetical protein CERSUDRAFT_123936 [Gelatoporia subvermispora B]|uniref:Uncharacterized protein n=1 Tax=Ceriporiopsis subvermispora (strain B) TaxID=914234 RepID=M2QIS2_CERS8|nr:hypothetical protein CERSUDRAFT_123936 [Gelatoporia subvermispora B]